ncbi:MAG: hypothetical protein WAW41_09500 [Methylobacter sp.]
MKKSKERHPEPADGRLGGKLADDQLLTGDANSQILTLVWLDFLSLVELTPFV